MTRQRREAAALARTTAASPTGTRAPAAGTDAAPAAGMHAAPAAGTHAASAGRAPSLRTVAVRLEWRLAGGLVTVTAATRARGSTRDETWWATPPLALTSATAVEATTAGTRRYVSRAFVATSSLGPDTTYTFSYAIVMRRHEITWAGGGRVTLTVGPDGSVCGTGSDHPRRRQRRR